MTEDEQHLTVGPLMLHLRMPATWYAKVLSPDDVLMLEKLLFLILAMIDCGVPLYDIQVRITRSDT